jgi:NADPH:quinone reductase-like Zn-dependent oxidoreductase
MMAIFPSIAYRYPAIPELDFSGTVVTPPAHAGEHQDPVDSSPFKPGDLVFGSIPVGLHLRGVGALAEYITLPPSTVAHLPSNPSISEADMLVQAAGLPVSGCTALALLKAAKLEAGMRVLVNGASGGVGSLVVQMVRRAVGEGGTVVAVCSGGNAEMVKGLGAGEAVDYVAHAPVYKELAKRCREDGEWGVEFDVVVDAFGLQELWINCPGFLKREGRWVTVGVAIGEYSVLAMLGAVGKMAGNALCPVWAGGVDRRYVQVTATANGKELRELGGMLGRGEVKGVVEGVWGMEDIGEPYEIMKRKRARGKIIVRVENGRD